MYSLRADMSILRCRCVASVMYLGFSHHFQEPSTPSPFSLRHDGNVHAAHSGDAAPDAADQVDPVWKYATYHRLQGMLRSHWYVSTELNINL